jgi:hypothetical protein
MKPAQGQRLSAVAVGKQSEVADLDETGGQHMEQEAADELDRVERHDAAAVTMTRVAPAKAHLAVFETEESSVGDGDPVRVAGQVLQYMLGSAERGLGVDHPLTPAQGPKPSGCFRTVFALAAGEMPQANFLAPAAINSRLSAWISSIIASVTVDGSKLSGR